MNLQKLMGLLCGFLFLVVAMGCPNPADSSEPDNTGDEGIRLSLSQAAIVFDTPDLSQSLTAEIEGVSDAGISWSTSDPYVAVVSQTGLVTSVAGGTATISAVSTADSTVSATCTVTVSEPNRLRADSYTAASSISSGAVSIIMCGDSTMRTYTTSGNDQSGWGQVLQDFFNSDVTVDNSISNGGRSSRSFYNEAIGYTTPSGQTYTADRWVKVKQLLQENQAAAKPTFVFIQFGHNDQKKITDSYGADFLTFARTNQNGTTAGTYYDYLERYIVEARALGGIPVLFTPFVRAYFEGGSITSTGQHNLGAANAGESVVRGDYPAAMTEIALKHDVPLIDITALSKTLVEAHSAAGTLAHIYVSGDSTHERTLGALLLAEAVVDGLEAQGILTNYISRPAPRLMMDANSLSFGSLYTGTSAEKSFMLSAYGDISGTITISAPDAYQVSVDGAAFASSVTIDCDSTWVGDTVTVRFAPNAVASYAGTLTLTHNNTSLAIDYGNTPANEVAGTITLSGIGKETVSGAGATALWPLVSAGVWTTAATVEGAISASAATLVGLNLKDVSNGARLTTLDGSWPAETTRNEGRYIEFAVPLSAGSFNLDEISMSIGSGGGSNMTWDVLYAGTQDFSSPLILVEGGKGTTKNVLDSLSEASIGLPVEAGQTMLLRVYPYLSSAATGKYLLLQDVLVSGVTN